MVNYFAKRINVKKTPRRTRESLTSEGHRILLTRESGDGGDGPEFRQRLDPRGALDITPPGSLRGEGEQGVGHCARPARYGLQEPKDRMRIQL
jgi:hypothetical protein